MNKKGEMQGNPILFLISAIILVFVGLAFITTVADTRSTQTKLQAVADEQSNLGTLSCYTVAGQVNESNSACNITVTKWYAAGDWRRSDSNCYISSVSVTNDTGTALTLNTDYRLYSNSGLIQLLNTTTTANSSAVMSDNLVEIDYSYCGTGYLTNSGDRSLANLWTTMMVIVLFIALGGVTIKMWKDWK